MIPRGHPLPKLGLNSDPRCHQPLPKAGLNSDHRDQMLRVPPTDKAQRSSSRLVFHWSGDPTEMKTCDTMRLSQLQSKMRSEWMESTTENKIKKESHTESSLKVNHRHVS